MKINIKLALILLTASIIFSGCFLKSVHPLVPIGQSELMNGLEGRWESEDQRWTFVNDPRNFENLGELDVEFDYEEGEEVEAKAYILLFENLQDVKADTVYFLATVKDFGENHFLDLSLLSALDDEARFQDYHLFPVHTFSRIRIKSDLLTINFFEHDWVRKLIMSNRVRIKHERIDSEILITASTDELQKFITKFGNNNEPFDDPIGLKRVSNEL